MFKYRIAWRKGDAMVSVVTVNAENLLAALADFLDKYNVKSSEIISVERGI